MAENNPGSTRRIKENSQLFIKCVDTNRKSFTEQTQTRDISESGISFYLKTPVWVDSDLTITIASSTLFGPLCSVGAKVVRVQIDTAGRQWQVHFDQFHTYNCCFGRPGRSRTDWVGDDSGSLHPSQAYSQAARGELRLTNPSKVLK